MPGVLEPAQPARKALSVAVQYKGMGPWELPGTHHDPDRVRKVLQDLYHYEDITILMDDDSGLYEKPTRKNILKAMRNLVRDAKPGDRLVFTFSGHGAQVPNLDGTEEDGFDEVIFPMDVVINDDGTYENYIIDDDIHEILVNHLPPGTHFMMVFDCCHSGTAADLPYNNDGECPISPTTSPLTSTVKTRAIRESGTQSTEHTHSVEHDLDNNTIDEKATSSPTNKLSSRTRISDYDQYPDVTSWSACTDAECTFEARSGGLFIRAFTEALKKNPYPQYGELLRAVTRELAALAAHANAKRSTNSQHEPYVLPSPQLGANHPMLEVYTHMLAI